MAKYWYVGAVIVGGAATIGYFVWTYYRRQQITSWAKEPKRTVKMKHFSPPDVSEEKAKEEVHQPSPPAGSILKAVKFDYLLHDWSIDLKKEYHFIADDAIVEIYRKNLMELGFGNAHIAEKTVLIIEKDERMLTPGSTILGCVLVLMVERIYGEYVKYLGSAGPNPIADLCEMPRVAEMKKEFVLKALYACTEEFRAKYSVTCI